MQLPNNCEQLGGPDPHPHLL